MEIAGRHVVMILVKNTVSLAEMVELGPSLAPDVVLLGLNDAPADGRDVSWIWDASLAPLLADRVVVVTGSRCADLVLRIRYDRNSSIPPPRLTAAIGSLARRSRFGGRLGTARRDRAHRRHLHGDDGAPSGRTATGRRARGPALKRHR